METFLLRMHLYIKYYQNGHILTQRDMRITYINTITGFETI